MVAVTEETKTTLILVGVFGALSISLMSLRLVMRKVRGQKWNWSDYLTMVAIFCMFGRTAFTTVVLLWQNNNISKAVRAKHTFTPEEIYRREVGSKLTLVNRVVYNIYIWIQKCVVLLLYHRMLNGLYWPERIMKAYWFVIPATLIPVQATCFSECHPVSLYWQVVPDPGSCPTAVVQLYVLVAMNIFTDILLIVLPMPWLLRMKVPLLRRVQLAFLFSIGIGLVIIAICRLPIYGRGTSQVNRNTLGSIEGFFAAFVANVPTLVTLRRPNDKNTTLASHTFGTSSRSRGDGSGGRSRREKFRRIGDDRVGTGSGSAGVVTKASVETMKTMDDGILVTRDIEMTRTEKKKETGYPKYLPPGVGSDEELVRETYSGR